MTEVPKRFEHEHKDAAEWLMAEYKRWGGLEQKIHIRPVAGRDGLPERNAPCFCGSGLKFKKCCLK